MERSIEKQKKKANRKIKKCSLQKLRNCYENIEFKERYRNLYLKIQQNR